uniref:adult-specific cuticular protein ACP-20-like isoform X1 n=1 Tax=Bombus vancouverensis nearcticus TaxID=2705178 RepID=UPI00143B1ABB|nr:adult-specific cuticular protein ACP-20-like isoform X1 [Bombus vancouverensis nearcticus]
MAFKISLTAILLLLVLFHEKADAGGHAHSFQHFHGPVIGDAREVTWKDKHSHHDHDYVAHPHYEFSYGVEDHHTGDYHGQKEHRDGKEVVGEYTIKEPGGNIRTVKYRAGKDGFFAHVLNSNESFRKPLHLQRHRRKSSLPV